MWQREWWVGILCPVLFVHQKLKNTKKNLKTYKNFSQN